ncbi:MAG: hypothetical protein LC641_07685 [Spirochaeta sp.]|nr:hypothetical protein [Spirochaeta sp.]
MAEDQFIITLEDALEKRSVYLDNHVIPRIREGFRTYHAAFQALTNIMVRKGLLAEDPYKADQRISEIAIPDDTSFTESEKDEACMIRLAAFDNQLDFLNQYVELSPENLDLRLIKTLVGLTNYVRWKQLSETSTHSLTRAVAEYLGRMKRDSDPLSVSIVNDSHDQLVQATDKVINGLRLFADYRKERYKLDMRNKVLSKGGVDPRLAAHPEQFVQAVRKEFAKHMRNQPFAQDLVLQILEEDHGTNTEEARRQALDRISIKEEAPKSENRAEKSFRSMLEEALRALAAGGAPLESIISRTRENYQLLKLRQLSVGERLRKWINRVVQQTEENDTLTVEFFNEATSSRQNESIPFEEFCTNAMKKAKLSSALQVKGSTVSRKLHDASDDQFFEFIHKNIEELGLIHRRFNSIDTYLKSEIPRDQRSRMRSIHSELAALKDALQRANKKNHAYVAKREEFEQMKRLGIKN